MMKRIMIKWHIAFIIFAVLFATIFSVYADSSKDKDIIQAVYDACSWETLKYNNKFDYSYTFAMKIENSKLSELSAQYGVEILVEDGAIKIDGRRYDIAVGYNNYYCMADTQEQWDETLDYSFAYWVNENNEMIELDESTYSYATFDYLTAIEWGSTDETTSEQQFPSDFSATHFNNLGVAVASDNDSLIEGASFDVLREMDDGYYATSDHPEPFIKIQNMGGNQIQKISTSGTTPSTQTQTTTPSPSYGSRDNISLIVGQEKVIEVQGNSTDDVEIGFSVATSGYYEVSVLNADGSKVQLLNGQKIDYVTAMATYYGGVRFVGTYDGSDLEELISENVSHCYLTEGVPYYVRVPAGEGYYLSIKKVRRGG